MREIWLLPDVEQTGVVMAIEQGFCKPLHEIIDLRVLPGSFVLGIPEDVLRNNQEENFVYAQYTRLTDGSALFSCSTRAGDDRSGRALVITSLQWLGSGEGPIIPPQVNPSASSKHVNEMLRFESCNDEAWSNVKLMLAAVKLKLSINSFASERMPKSANKPRWMPPTKKPRASSWQ